MFHTSPVITCLSIPLFHQRLSLNYGVPVKVVLDVVCSEHASHLEVSQRQPVLLAQLDQVTCHGGSCVAHRRDVRVSWRAHQRGNALSRVYVHVSRADVLVVLVVLAVLIVLAGLGVHGPVRLGGVLRGSWGCRVLDLRLRVGGALRGDDPCGSEELVNGGTQVGHLGEVQRPVVELRLPHALLQTLKWGEVYVSPVVAGSDAAALFQPVQVWVPV